MSLCWKINAKQSNTSKQTPPASSRDLPCRRPAQFVTDDMRSPLSEEITDQWVFLPTDFCWSWFIRARDFSALLLIIPKKAKTKKTIAVTIIASLTKTLLPLY